MTADVYADDDGARAGARGARPRGAAIFNVVADADPDLLLRVGAVLNLLNVVPREFHLEAAAEGTAAVRALVECAEAQADLVARKLQRITSVRDVVVAYSPAREIQQV